MVVQGMTGAGLGNLSKTDKSQDVWFPEITSGGLEEWLSSPNGPRFSSWHPHGDTQPVSTPVPESPMPSSCLQGLCIHTVHKHTCRRDIHT